PAPEANHTLVRIAFSGLNPADIKHGRQLGIRDTVAGYDFSGTVVGAGPGSRFSVGDRIAGCTPSSLGRPPHFGTHQDYAIVPDGMAWKLPDDGSLPLEDAACMAVSTRTAADVVFNHLRYPLPGESFGNQALPALLVWGGASSLGFMAIQFARAVGVKHIYTTASAANHAALRELGATRCFDYREPDVVDEIRKAAAAEVPGGRLTRIFDAVGDPGQRTGEMAFACAGEGEQEEVIKVCSTIYPGALMPLASLELPFSFSPPGAEGKVVTVPPRPEEAARVFEALEWAVGNYGRAFKIPTVEVVDKPVGELVRELEERCERGASFRKVCFKHPFRE
ncbi:Trans-enoyl reductase ccsC, partial [Lasiodiplodia theobromae]